MNQGRTCKYFKQKSNTKSSIEPKLIGASDYIALIVWIKKFLREKIYKIRRIVFFQDNTSAMKLESNELQSYGEKSRHTDIKFFFTKDVLKRENIELKHCPTERMIADHFTKPLQGALFKKLRDMIMDQTPYLTG